MVYMSSGTIFISLESHCLSSEQRNLFLIITLLPYPPNLHLSLDFDLSPHHSQWHQTLPKAQLEVPFRYQVGCAAEYFDHQAQVVPSPDSLQLRATRGPLYLYHQLLATGHLFALPIVLHHPDHHLQPNKRTRPPRLSLLPKGR